MTGLAPGSQVWVDSSGPGVDHRPLRGEIIDRVVGERPRYQVRLDIGTGMGPYTVYADSVTVVSILDLMVEATG